MLKKISLLTLLLASFLVYTSCGDDDDEVDSCDTFTATYNGDVKGIINSSCAYAGCHAGGADAGSNIPMNSNNFTTFTSLKPNLDSGGFNTRALVAQNMPPNNVPAGFPTELTSEQLEILICWRDAGFPEN